MSREAPLVWRVLSLLVICALLMARGLPALAAGTDAGTLISSPQAQISGTVSGSPVSAVSNAPTALSVLSVYGLDDSNNTGNDLNNTKTISSGIAEYIVGVMNSGNASGSVGVRISIVSDGGAEWAFAIDDQETFTSGLTWQGGGATFTSSFGSTTDTATAAQLINPDAYATFTILVTPVSGVEHGATLEFDVDLLTGDTPVRSYTGYNASAYGGSSVLSTARKTAVAQDVTGPTVAITSPAQGALLTGSVTVTGSAYETNFASYTLSYGPGVSPTAWGIINNSTTAVTTGALGTWNTGDLYGTYTLRLQATDIAGNFSQTSITVFLRNTNTTSMTIPAGRWTMVSFPGVPSVSNPRTIFGSDVEYEVQQWDPSDPDGTDYLKKYTLNFSVETAGEGFWVKPYGQDLSFSVEMSYTDTTQEYSIPLTAGWNQIGCPYDRADGMIWQNVMVWNAASGTEMSLVAANAAGWMDLDLNEYVYLDGFDGGMYRATDSKIFPDKAYFVQTYADVELRFNPTEGRGAVARIVRPRFDWKMNLAARTANSADTDNTAAVMFGAEGEYDKQDSGEPPAVEPYVSLYFDNQDWKRHPGRYKKDFRPPAEGAARMEWPFVIETSDKGGAVTLSAPDATMLPGNYSFVIRDEETGEEFDPRITPEYEYTDSGEGTRRFTLKASKQADAQTVTLSHTYPGGWNLFSVPLEPEPTEVRSQLSDDLENVQVFQYYDTSLYNPDSPEHVDIQAGIGYWLHLDSETELDFTGTATDGSVPVEIPLVRGWNLIGNPYTFGIALGTDARVEYNGTVLSLAQAMEAGVIAPNIYGFNENTGGYESYAAETTMIPWKGYAIEALQQCTLVIRTGLE